MTLEQRTFISPKDILAIEYGCNKCRTRLLTPVKDYLEALQQCPNCKGPMISASHGEDSSKASNAAAVYTFAQALKDIQGRGLNLRLEISAAEGS